MNNLKLIKATKVDTYDYTIKTEEGELKVETVFINGKFKEFQYSPYIEIGKKPILLLYSEIKDEVERLEKFYNTNKEKGEPE
jgi:hypothetical protein